MCVKSNLYDSFSLKLDDLPNEIWLDITNYVGVYKISNYGRIKSLQRVVNGRNINEKILKSHCSIYRDVVLSDGNVKTHKVAKLVYEHFKGQILSNHVITYIDGNPKNCSVHNLELITKSQCIKNQYKNPDRYRATDSIGNVGSLVAYRKKKQEDYLQQFCNVDNGIITHKVCISCMVEYPVNNYYENEKHCKNCIKKRSGVIEIDKYNNAIELAKAGLRKCCDCKEIKKLDIDFNKSKNSYLGKSHLCRNCSNKRNEVNNAKRKNKTVIL